MVIEEGEMAKHQYSRVFKQYTLLCSDPDHVIYNLLDEIRKQTIYGHSFDVVIDPGTSNSITAFVDGDGCDKIHSIAVRAVEQMYEYDDEELIRNDKANVGAEHEQSQD